MRCGKCEQLTEKQFKALERIYGGVHGSRVNRALYLVFVHGASVKTAAIDIGIHQTAIYAAIRRAEKVIDAAKTIVNG